MGVDARIFVPYTAAIDDVVELAGLLAGLPVDTGSRYPRVQGVRVNAECGALGMFPHFTVRLDAPDGVLVDGQPKHFMTYHGVTTRANQGKPGGHHYLIAKSTAFWIGVGVGLVDFFGGTLDVNDCDMVATDHVVRARPACPDDDPGYTAYREALLSVPPLTVSDLDLFDPFASYPGAHREALSAR